jgi:hypothetical protein
MPPVPRARSSSDAPPGTAKVPSLGDSDWFTRDGVARTTSRTSSSSPAPPPLPGSRCVIDCVAGCHALASGRRPAKKKWHDAMFFVKPFRRSEIPTCRPERRGTHNKSDILLVSSTFADPGFPLPRGGEFSTCRVPVPPWRRVFNLPCSRSHVAASFQLAESGHLPAAAMRRRDGKGSVARRFRLVARSGVARTTSRTSSSSPPPSPIPAGPEWSFFMVFQRAYDEDGAIMTWCEA